MKNEKTTQKDADLLILSKWPYKEHIKREENTNSVSSLSKVPYKPSETVVNFEIKSTEENLWGSEDTKKSKDQMSMSKSKNLPQLLK